MAMLACRFFRDVELASELFEKVRSRTDGSNRHQNETDCLKPVSMRSVDGCVSRPTSASGDEQ
jgi:hypothetical protein